MRAYISEVYTATDNLSDPVLPVCCRAFRYTVSAAGLKYVPLFHAGEMELTLRWMQGDVVVAERRVKLSAKDPIDPWRQRRELNDAIKRGPFEPCYHIKVRFSIRHLNCTFKASCRRIVS